MQQQELDSSTEPDSAVELSPTYAECPPHLNEAGREWWAWLRQHYSDEEIAGVYPAAVEGAECKDRLAQIRAELAKQPLMSGTLRSGPRRHPLLAEEARVQKNFIMVWRTMGLAEKEDGDHRPVGRPSGSGKDGKIRW